MLQHKGLVDCAEPRTAAALCRCSQMLVLSVLAALVIEDASVEPDQWFADCNGSVVGSVCWIAVLEDGGDE